MAPGFFHFAPASNDDLVTALIFVDDVTAEKLGPWKCLRSGQRPALRPVAWRQFHRCGGSEKLVADMRCRGEAGKGRRAACASCIRGCSTRFGPQQIDAAAHTVHHRLFGRGCDPPLAQPPRMKAASCMANVPAACVVLRAPAAVTQAGLVLRPAGGELRRLTRRSPTDRQQRTKMPHTDDATLRRSWSRPPPCAGRRQPPSRNAPSHGVMRYLQRQGYRVVQ